jgi:hypothetical protein
MRIILLLLFICSASVMAQPSITFQRCTGGTDGDQSVYVTRTHDNGFIVAAVASSVDGDVINSHGNDEAYIIRFDSANNLMWKKSYGGSSDDNATYIMETSDHGFIFVGFSSSSDGDVTINYGDDDIWIVKIDSAGNILWQKSYGGSGSDNAFSIIQNTNGDFLVLGMKSDPIGYWDYWLLNINSSGNLNWQKTYGGSDDDAAYQVIQTLDGGYMLAGFTYSNDGNVTTNHGEEDVWLVKTDSTGNLQWQKTYGGSYEEYLDNVMQLSNGDYVFAASASSDDGDVQSSILGPDFWVVKTDPSGNIISEKCFGGTGWDEPYRMIHTSDNGFIVTGVSGSNDVDVSDNNGDWDAWTLKLDSNLNKVWEINAGGTDEDLAYGVCELSPNEYVVTGYTFSNDIDVSGNHGGGYEDIWTFRISTITGVPEIVSGNEMHVFPNPATTNLNVQFYSDGNRECIIAINDVCGRRMIQRDMTIATGINKVQFNTGNFDPGIYVLTVTLNNDVLSKRIIIE